MFGKMAGDFGALIVALNSIKNYSQL